MSYLEDTESDAKDTIQNFRDEIIDALRDRGEASDDLLNDYPNGDSYHHENHVYKEYDLEEAAQVLSELSNYEETDTGLWDGLQPEQAISAKAAYTYGNAVMGLFQEKISEINQEWEAVENLLS